MKEMNDIKDDQIRVIGDDGVKNPWMKTPREIILIAAGVLLLIGIIVFVVILCNRNETQEIRYYNSDKNSVIDSNIKKIGSEVDSLAKGFVEVVDMSVGSMPLRVYIPHNSDLSLHVGRIDKRDTTIVYVAQAADIRADNGGIVGAFVLKGEPLSWGLSKKGYCASIGGVVTIGVAENSPLFEKATEDGGYFFRQYPLVKNGKLVENEPQGKYIRRSICARQGEVFMVETPNPESLNEFAQALVDLGVQQAIYLVGSTAYGWAIDENGTRHEFGVDDYYTGRIQMPENITYIVWRKK